GAKATRSDGPFGPWNVTVTFEPPMASAGAVTLTSEATTRSGRLASTPPPAPATYLTSYSPASTGAVRTAGVPNAARVEASIAGGSAPTGTTVSRSPAL